MKKLFTLLFLFAFVQLGFGQLSGDYYIPQGANPQGYATLAAAFADLNTNGCTGTVNFLIDADLAETGANLLITRTDLTASNNLVIKPAPTKSPIINITGCTATAGANQYAGLTLNGASYITIDGSNTVGGTTRDLAFVMNDATGRDGVVLYGNCDNVTLKNFKVRYVGIQSTTTGRGVYLNGQSTGAADNCTIDNCEIGENLETLVGPHHGIGFTGSSTSLIYCNNGVISNNLIYANIRGLNLFWHNGSGSTMNIFGNTISIMNPLTGNAIWGILHQNYTGTTNFYNNRINAMTQKSTATQGIYGFGTLNGVAGSGTVTNVYNNFLGGAFNHTAAGIPASIDVISFQDAPANSIVRVYHNTVVLNSFANISGTRNSCIRFNPVSTQTFEIRNNIFVNNIDNAKAYVFHYGGVLTPTFTSNYNLAYVSGSSAFIGLASSDRKTLANWIAACTPNQDVNSKSKAVTFAGATDLHLSGSSNGDTDLIGETGLGILTDIDGDTRSLTFPYMGADEASTALPVELTSFTASVIGSKVKLSWQTATEINNYGFEIERKTKNEKSETWEKIGFVNGNGNSNSPKSYSFTDESASIGKYSYRLKQIDNDGTFEFSKSVEVDLGVPKEFTLSQNYPNPFNPTTKIIYTLPVDAQVTLQIYSITGELIESLVSEHQSQGSYTIDFDGRNYASGTYIYRLIANDFVHTKKMILIK